MFEPRIIRIHKNDIKGIPSYSDPHRGDRPETSESVEYRDDVAIDRALEWALESDLAL